MKNLLTVLFTVFIFGLWLIPAFMMYHSEPSSIPSFWGMLYIPIFVVTLMWMSIVNRNYFTIESK